MTGHPPWCPGRAQPGGWSEQAGDGGYENRVVVDTDRQTLIKQYQRATRFHSEALALDLLGPLGFSPRVHGVCAPHRALRMDRIDARPLEGPLLSGRGDDETAALLGGLLRRLHDTAAPGVGPLNAPCAEDWPYFLRQHLAARLASLPLASCPADQLWAYLEEHLADQGKDGAACVLHHDLKPANILRTPEGSLMLCDFDQARGGNPSSDLGKLWWRTFATSRSRPWQVFLSAYGRPDDEQTQRAVSFYLIVHCIGALAYWHDHARPGYHRHARCAQRLLAARTGVRCPLGLRRREPA